MDGVLANFEGWAINNIGDDWKTEIKAPNWGKFYNYPNLYSLLPPMEYAKELYEACCTLVMDRDRVQILTALPSKVKFFDAPQNKIEWVDKYIHTGLRVNFGPYAKDKQYHCKLSSDILIDDSAINISQWKGIGILHTSFEDTIKKLNCVKEMADGNIPNTI